MNNHQMFIYFSQLMDRPVVDSNGVSVGEIYDIVVRPTQVYPQSSHLIIRKGFPNRKYALIAWSDIVKIEGSQICLKIENSKIDKNLLDNHCILDYP